jgi:HEAT repeats
MPGHGQDPRLHRLPSYRRPASSLRVAQCPMPAEKRTKRIAVTAVAVIVLGALVLGATARRAVAAQGKPQRSSAALLSEHEIESLDSMSPQSQAELLLERSINHFRGANEQITARVDRWRGKIKKSARLDGLFVTAINSDDMRVRAAGLDVNIVVRNLDKSSETVDRLEPVARSGEQGARANALWDLGLLGNRGIQPERVASILLSSIHDENQNVRYWAVEGLAYLGTDETIATLLDIFHDDPSATIRERAACSLAQSGMLTESQRRTAVPRLLDFAGDFSLDPETRGWVFQALRDITGMTLPPDPGAWRHWYELAGVK